MSAEPNSRSSLSDGIRVSLITRKAEKGFFALDPPAQERVIGDLNRVVPGHRYRKLHRWASVGLFHFDVTDSVRVTCLDVNGQSCVIHIGRHAEFDKFVDQFDGQRPQHPKPLEESRIMKNSRPQSTKVPTLPPARPVQAVAPASTPSTSGEAADAFSRYVSLLFEAGFAKERERLNDEVLQFADSITAARAECVSGTAALTERLGRTGETVARLETAVAELSLTTTESVGRLESSAAEEAAATAGNFSRVDSELTTLAGQVDELEAACGRTHTTFAADLAVLNRDLLRVGDEVTAQGRRMEELHATHATRCDEVAEGLTAARQQAVCHEAEYRRFAADVTRERNELREALAEVRRELTAVRRRLDDHERVEADAARQQPVGFFRRLARLVSFGSIR